MPRVGNMRMERHVRRSRSVFQYDVCGLGSRTMRMQVCRNASRDGFEKGSVAMWKRSVDAAGHQANMHIQATIEGIPGTTCGVHDFNGSGAGHGAEPQFGRNLGMARLETDGDVYMTGYGANLETVM